LPYDFLKEFQTLAVGVIGFGGVIITQWRNGELSREMISQQAKQEQRSVACAIQAELRFLRTSLQTQKESLSKKNRGELENVLVPWNRSDQVYQNLISQIGKLEPKQIEAIILAYGQYEVYRSKLELLGVQNQIKPSYVEVSEKWTLIIAEHCRHVIEKADCAIELLSRD